MDHSVQHAYRTYDEIVLRADRFTVHHFDQQIVPDAVISSACGQQIDAQKFDPELRSSTHESNFLNSVVEILDAIARREWRGQRATENQIFGAVADLDTLASIVDQPADQLEDLLNELTANGEIVQLQAHDLFASRRWVPAPEFFAVATGDELLALLHPQSVPVVEENCPQLRKALRFDWDHIVMPRPGNSGDIGDALGW